MQDENLKHIPSGVFLEPEGEDIFRCVCVGGGLRPRNKGRGTVNGKDLAIIKK